MPSTKGGSLNGGIIGKTNSTSFGKNKTTKVTASGCYTTPSTVGAVQVAVIAGGGGGGGDKGGGGGAGGLLNPGAVIPVTASTGYPVTIGGGGGGSPQPSPGTPLLGVPGCNSTAIIGGVTITATGGGRGGGTGDTAGDPGGSGGGGGFHDANGPYPGSPGTCGQGNAGGASNAVHSPGACGSGSGGGGGAGAAGGDAPSSKPNTQAGIGGAGINT